VRTYDLCNKWISSCNSSSSFLLCASLMPLGNCVFAELSVIGIFLILKYSLIKKRGDAEWCPDQPLRIPSISMKCETWVVCPLRHVPHPCNIFFYFHNIFASFVLLMCTTCIKILEHFKNIHGAKNYICMQQYPLEKSQHVCSMEACIFIRNQIHVFAQKIHRSYNM
jgi:hypothetical protein